MIKIKKLRKKNKRKEIEKIKNKKIIIKKNKIEKRNHMSALGHRIFGLVSDYTLFGLI